MRYFVTVRDNVYEIELAADGVRIAGERVQVELTHVDGTTLHHVLIDGQSHRLLARRGEGGNWIVHLGGRDIIVNVLDESMRRIRDLSRATAATLGPEPVRAPMPGLVVKVEVSEGQEVRAGQGVAVVEAMKMENELRAQVTGVVSRVHVTPGQTVEKNQVLVEFRALGDDAP